MLKKTIEFTDYNDKKRKEDFYFNLSKAELMEMELGTSGGFAEMLQKLVDTQNIPEIMKIFKKVIMKAYGVKSPDGMRFIKSDELSKEFTETEAYSELFMELLSDTDAATAFVNGIIPADAAKQLADQNHPALQK